MAWPCQAFEHEPNHCEMDEGCDGCGVAFEVSHQAAVSADPGKAPLSSARQDMPSPRRLPAEASLRELGACRGGPHRPISSGDKHKYRRCSTWRFCYRQVLA